MKYGDSNQFPSSVTKVHVLSALVGCGILLGCSGIPDDGIPVSEDEQRGWQEEQQVPVEGQVSQPILSGSISEKVTGHGHTVQVNHICTGTLLRNDIVLTARHCFSPPYDHPENIRVQTGFDGTTWTEEARADSIDVMNIGDCTWCPSGWDSSHTDAAILHLSTPLPIDGEYEGTFRGLYPWADENLVGDEITCEGWGNSTCGGGDGKLRYMITTVDEVDYGGMYRINPSATGQTINLEDSGGSCWLWEDSASKYRQVLGVNKYYICSPTGKGRMIMNTTIRPWVRSLLGHYATDYFTTFDAPSELADWTVMTPPTSTGEGHPIGRSQIARCRSTAT